jgi:hypothetical protein
MDSHRGTLGPIVDDRRDSMERMLNENDINLNY